MSEPSLEAEVPSQIREDLVKTAIKFLQNPNVIKTSLAEQQRFLQRKGLNDAEIRVACERSGAYSYHEQKAQPLPPPVATGAPMYHQSSMQITLFHRIRDVVHNIAAFSFVAYIIYKFYQRFIEPFLFGKKKNIEDTIEELDKNVRKSVNELQTNLTSVKIEVDKLGSSQDQLSDLKLDMATVKGLLLNRSQFPPVSKGAVIRQSIPEWQKISISQDSDSDPERKAEDLLEVGSGSGSEPDHNAKNSDSSLDIISFSSKDSDFRRHKAKEEVDDDGDDDEDDKN